MMGALPNPNDTLQRGPYVVVRCIRPLSNLWYRYGPSIHQGLLHAVAPIFYPTGFDVAGDQWPEIAPQVAGGQMIVGEGRV